MTRTSLSAVLLALLLGACQTQDSPVPQANPSFVGPAGSMKQGIVGGSLDTNAAHAAVVYIEMSGLGACTGTLVNTQWIVTAAHCTWNENTDTAINSVGSYSVYFPDANGNPSRYVGVSEVHRHSDWDNSSAARTQLYSDVAVLKLKSAQTVTPIPVLPSSLLGNLTAGKTVEYVGYGITKYPGVTCDPNYGNCGGGTRMHVSAKLDTVCNSNYSCSMSNGGTASKWTICGTQNPGGTCSGDSGGPAFLVVSGTEYVVGATSYGDQSCQYFGCSTNLAHYESFLAQYLGAGYANGHSCSAGLDCKSGFCISNVCCNTACGAECYSCSTGSCSALVGSSCNDNNPCTVNDQCNGGSCSGTVKDCGASTGCTTGGSCNLTTGSCEGGGPKANGTACEDGNPCTQGDTCQSGACQSGAASNNCPAPDSCHEGSTCNTATGTCAAFPAKPNGTACDDGDPCTGGDSCLAGSCLPSTRVSCPAPDDCHEAGACVSATGKCPSSYPSKPNGTGCNDHNACTNNDVCTGGLCKGTPTTSACAADQCHQAGTCSATTGLCSGANMPDGTSCNDNDAATEADQCTNGICKGRPIGLDPCYGAAVGTACDDKNKCTRDDFCSGNVCLGTNPKPCNAPPDDCHESSGTCDWQTGECAYKSAANGTSCDDGDSATTDDHCENGHCVGTSSSECVGKDDGTACTGGSCKSGDCVANPPPATGACGCGTTNQASAFPSAMLFAIGAAAVLGRRRR